MSVWSQLRRALGGEAVPEIDARDLAARIEAGRAPLLLDVRTLPEYLQSHIPGAEHVPFLAMEPRVTAIPAGTEVVAICLSAHRSVPAVRLLRELGLPATQLRGGMLAWWRAKLPTEAG